MQKNLLNHWIFVRRFVLLFCFSLVFKFLIWLSFVIVIANISALKRLEFDYDDSSVFRFKLFFSKFVLTSHWYATIFRLLIWIRERVGRMRGLRELSLDVVRDVIHKIYRKVAPATWIRSIVLSWRWIHSKHSGSAAVQRLGRAFWLRWINALLLLPPVAIPVANENKILIGGFCWD